MRVTTEHRKRKDLHIHMVLVSTAVGGVDLNDLSQVPTVIILYYFYTSAVVRIAIK